MDQCSLAQGRPDHRRAISVGCGGHETRARIGVDLEAVNAGSTRLSLHVEIDFKGLARLGAPIVKATMPLALKADLRRVEALARRAVRAL